jgi:hypothetical protein
MVDLSQLNSNDGSAPTDGPVPVETFFVIIRKPDLGWVVLGTDIDIARLMKARDPDMVDFISGCTQVLMDIQGNRTAQAVTGMMTMMAAGAMQAQQNAAIAAQLVKQREKGG